MSGTTVTVLGNTGALTRPGYTFSGWNTAINDSGTNYAPGSIFLMGSGNMILYAKWTPIGYTITYNLNSGTNNSGNPTSYTIETPTITLKNPTKTGYSFIGWYAEAGFTTAVTQIALGSTGDKKLFARWGQLYTVTYDGNDATSGSVPVDAKKYEEGNTVTVLDSGTLVKTDYKFVGWDTLASGNGISHPVGSTFTMKAANVILFAKWAQLCYVRYSGNGNSSGTVPAPASYIAGATVIVAGEGDLVRTDFQFAGWNTTANGSGTSYMPGATFPISSNVTLYAKWASLVDADGNRYTTVTIGVQTWMVENLKTTKYNDSTEIPLVMDNAAWFALTSPGYCWYGNDIANKAMYGALYNWYTLAPTNPKKVAPAGWHVPTDAEWDTLQNYLIANGYNWDNTTTGNKVAKSMAAKTNWAVSTTAGAIGNDLTANNRSGFSALPGGCRYGGGNFVLQSDYGSWWSATELDASSAWYRYLYYDDGYLYRDYYLYESCGFSVRLLRD
jgi:uncharacterized protein (TIGR02145 family)/uncharacterized repeat protein (TIGR02543 family)